MKKIILYSTLLSAILTIALSSCMMDDKNKDSKEVADDRNDAKFDDKKEEDAGLLVSAAEINLEEIQLGKLAQSNSNTSEVKELGKMMENEHSKALKELQSLAANKRISIPTTLTENGQTAYNKLLDKTGANFDKEYCDMMVNGHQKAIERFEKASTRAFDNDIKVWANDMIPTLKKHLEHSIACQKICDKQ